MVPLKDQKVKEFDHATFECEVSKTGLKAKWLKGDTELKASDRYEMVTLGQRHLLHIHNAELADQDTYTVVVEEGVTSTAKLTVEGKSRFVIK